MKRATEKCKGLSGVAVDHLRYRVACTGVGDNPLDLVCVSVPLAQARVVETLAHRLAFGPR